MKKTNLYLSETEWEYVRDSLIALKNKLHKAGKHTDLVDETLLKVMTAKYKKVKIA